MIHELVQEIVSTVAPAVLVVEFFWIFVEIFIDRVSSETEFYSHFYLTFCPE